MKNGTKIPCNLDICDGMATVFRTARGWKIYCDYCHSYSYVARTVEDLLIHWYGAHIPELVFTWHECEIHPE